MSYSDFFHVLFLLFKNGDRHLSLDCRILNVFCQSCCSKLDLPWIHLYPAWKLVFLWWNMRAEFRLFFFFFSFYLWPIWLSLPFYGYKFIPCILYHCILPDSLRLDPSENAVFDKSFKMLKLWAVSDLYFLQNKTDIIMKQNLITPLVLPYIPNFIT